MKNNSENDALRDYLEDQIKRFDRYPDALEQVYKISRESTLPNIQYICDGFCPECERILECEGYDEEEWEGLYT